MQTLVEGDANLRLKSFVGLLDPGIGLLVDSAAELACGMHAGDSLGLALLFACFSQAIRSTILRPLIDTMSLIVEWAAAAAWAGWA